MIAVAEKPTARERMEVLCQKRCINDAFDVRQFEMLGEGLLEVVATVLECFIEVDSTEVECTEVRYRRAVDAAETGLRCKGVSLWFIRSGVRRTRVARQ